MKRRTFLQISASSAAVTMAAIDVAQATAAPAETGPLWSWNATSLARAIRSGTITSREATQSALDRIAEVNGTINAVVDVLADEALAAADRADAAVADRHVLGPLHGVPVTVKINVDMAGHATTNGIKANKDKIAQSDSSPVRNWRKAGAIIVGRTNTPAMSFRWFTENDLHGRTYNPWNKDITPGGSSGGAAAAVAAGMGALAHGNDIAGSVRYPAYACGVVGLRPSLGRIPNRSAEARTLSSSLMAVQGVLGRSIDDVKIGLETMAQQDPGDPWWSPAPIAGPGLEVRRKILLFRGMDGYEPDALVSKAMEDASTALSDAGFSLEERELPHFAEGQDLWSMLVMNESRRSFSRAVAEIGDSQLERFVTDWLEITPEADLDSFSEAAGRRSLIAGEWDMLFEDYSAILMPNSWESPFKWGRDQEGPDAIRELLRLQSPMLLPALLGIPGLSVPTGSDDGIPSGVQIVSRRFREDVCLALGQVLESRLGVITPVTPTF